MSLRISHALLAEIHLHGERAYPEEGAGFLMGRDDEVRALLPLSNAREDAARHNRYLIAPQDFMHAELKADELGLALIGVFHSHPDHANQPSEFDREWAQPVFSYVITTVEHGRAIESRSWKLREDRSQFDEENLELT